MRHLLHLVSVCASARAGSADSERPGGPARHHPSLGEPCPGTIRRPSFRRQEPVKNPVDELAGLDRAEPPCQFHRFVDDHRAGRIGVEQLEGGQSQYVAVRRRHPVERPMFGRFAQDHIDLRAVAPRAGNQRAGKLYKLDAAELLFLRRL